MATSKEDYLEGPQKLSMTGVGKKDLNTPNLKMKTFNVNDLSSNIKRGG